MSRIFFPLRTSVEFFGDARSVAAVTRAKEAAILYDELVFEAGLYEISITEEGSFANWRPPGMFTADDLANSRQLPEPGSGVQISFGIQPSVDVPAPPEAMRAIISGPLTASYVAEWHTGVLNELSTFKPTWAGVTMFAEADPKLEPLKPAISAATTALEQAYPPDTANSMILRDFTIKTLTRDAVIAASIDAAMNVTSLFSPLMSSIGGAPDPSGGTALGILVPNVAGLSWEDISAFREHGGAEDARGKLRDFEERALAADPTDPLDFQREAFRAVSGDLMATVNDLSPKLATGVAKEAAKTAISFVPLVGPFLGPGTSFVEALYAANQQRHAWYAAIMQLRDAI